METQIPCPSCGKPAVKRQNPFIKSNLIIERSGATGKTEIVLVQKRKAPHPWVLPGGYVDYGESLEIAAMREAREETGLNVEIIRQFHAYSRLYPEDPRPHAVTVVYLARMTGGELTGMDDAMDAGFFTRESLPSNLPKNVSDVLEDYFYGRY